MLEEQLECDYREDLEGTEKRFVVQKSSFHVRPTIQFQNKIQEFEHLIGKAAKLEDSSIALYVSSLNMGQFFCKRKREKKRIQKMYNMEI